MPFDLATSIADDCQIFDGVQTITLEKIDGSGTQSVDNVTSGPLSKKQTAMAAGLVSLEDETQTFSLPVSELGGVTPQQEMKLTDAAGVVWKILFADTKTLSTRVSAACVKTRSAAVEYRPILTVPAAQSAITNVDKSITETSVEMVVDAAITTTLTVTHGTLTLAGVDGLTFTVGDGDDDATMTFSGSVADTNTAIATLVYTPTTDYYGSALLTVRAARTDNDDNYDEQTVAITVFAPPAITVQPGSPFSGTEDAARGLSGLLSFSDADSSSITVALTNDRSAIFHLGTTTGLSTVSGSNNSAAWSFSGTLANINNAFQGTFTVAMPADQNGACIVTVNATDGMGAAAPATFTINFAAVNDAPRLTSAGTVTDSAGNFPRVLWPAAVLTEVESQNITGFGIAITAGGQASDKFDGPTTGGGITVTGNGTNSITLTGSATAAAYQAKIRQITFEPDSGTPTGDRTLSVDCIDASNAHGVTNPHIVVT